MSEILTTEQVAIIRKDPLSSHLMWRLCDGYEKLRTQLAETQQELDDERHVSSDLCNEADDTEAALRELAAVVREHLECRAYPEVYAVLNRPGVLRRRQ